MIFRKTQVVAIGSILVHFWYIMTWGRGSTQGKCLRLQSSWGQHGAHLGPVSPRWAPCWPHEPCYQGCITLTSVDTIVKGVLWYSPESNFTRTAHWTEPITYVPHLPGANNSSAPQCVECIGLDGSGSLAICVRFCPIISGDGVVVYISMGLIAARHSLLGAPLI